MHKMSSAVRVALNGGQTDALITDVHAPTRYVTQPGDGAYARADVAANLT